jgi:trans-2,3-dihydro-3-hydroxyanthranilate isomerase
MTELAFVTYDVFTEKRFGGNPLAVFPDAGDLDIAEMQTIAREFNLSETVFVSPVAGKPLHRRLRILTPNYELPFAGHPTVGTAVALAELGAFPWPEKQNALEIEFEEGVGPVPVRIERRQGRPLYATLSMPRLPERGPDGPDLKSLARVLGLDVERLSKEVSSACYGAGVPFTIVPVRDAEALAAIALDLGAWRQLMAETWGKALFVIVLSDLRDKREIRARMFPPAMGITEDPATGAAVVALAGFLAEKKLVPQQHSFACTVRQGEEMGRPSRLALEMDFAEGRLQAIRLGGAAVAVSRGTFLIDADR